MFNDGLTKAEVIEHLVIVCPSCVDICQRWIDCPIHKRINCKQFNWTNHQRFHLRENERERDATEIRWLEQMIIMKVNAIYFVHQTKRKWFKQTKKSSERKWRTCVIDVLFIEFADFDQVFTHDQYFWRSIGILIKSIDDAFKKILLSLFDDEKQRFDFFSIMSNK